MYSCAVDDQGITSSLICDLRILSTLGGRGKMINLEDGTTGDHGPSVVHVSIRTYQPNITIPASATRREIREALGLPLNEASRGTGE